MSMEELGQDARDAQLDRLLEYLRDERDFDFTGYKRATLTRRIEKRRQAVGADDLDQYLARLREDADEYARLFNTILINVTEFFRDDVPWEFLEREIIPKLFGRRPAEVRVWSAGCAGGQEAYSLAMAIADATSPEEYRERVKIYATDVDEEALAAARAGSYTERDVGSVSAQRLARYFDRVGGRYVFHKELRRSIIFGRNDLVRDAPISRIDLLVCRNTLMYFDPETQARILSRLHFALKDGGHLFLGRAETLMSHSKLFVPVDLKRRIFTKVSGPSFEDRLLSASRRTMDVGQLDDRRRQLLTAAFHAGMSAQIVVNRSHELILANDRAQALLRLTPSDVGRPLQDIELSPRPVDLRSMLELALAERRAVSQPDVEWRADGESRWYEVCVTPLVLADGDLAGASIDFVDSTLARRLQQQLVQSSMELETAYEELQTTNEELETTNEELQSTVEELETTNEELQATNEELETMNEELQAANEELHTINDEHRRRSDELNEVNEFLESIFTSVRAGVIVVDRDLTVLVWSSGADDLWGLRASEAEGRPLLNLDFGLPVEQLANPLRSVVNGEVPTFEQSLAATNRRGRPIDCRVVGNALVAPHSDAAPRGAILLMTVEPSVTRTGGALRQGASG